MVVFKLKVDQNSQLVPKIINGSIAGIIGISSVYPLDLVKTRLQNQRTGCPFSGQRYLNLFDCFKKRYRAHGVPGFYRGLLVTLIMSSPEKMVQLTANEFFRYNLRTNYGELTVPRQMAAGGLTGLSQMIISTPMELVKINMQISDEIMRPNVKRRTTARSILMNVIREKGFLGMYRGFKSTALREFSFSFTFLTIFSKLNELFPHRSDGTLSAWCLFVAGLFAASFSAWFVTPIDVVKTRIQASLKCVEGRASCNRMLDCAANIYNTEGMGAFYKGGLCRVLALAPLLAIAQFIHFLQFGEKIVSYSQAKY